ncbi:MAG: hypothetical protein WAO01_19525 [Bradyrhizobium sp.]
MSGPDVRQKRTYPAAALLRKPARFEAGRTANFLQQHRYRVADLQQRNGKQAHASGKVDLSSREKSVGTNLKAEFGQGAFS